MTTTTLAADVRGAAPETAARLAVAWQHPQQRSIEPVGLLTYDGEGFTFAYLGRASHVTGFQPFLGFPELTSSYWSERLFPLFGQRVMGARRPDYPRHLQTLALGPDARPWEILARSQGQRHGDGVRVVAEPAVEADGTTRATFFVSGLPYRIQDHPEIEVALDRLRVGEALTLVPQPDNPVDCDAVLVAQRSGVTLGWVPHVLLPYLAVVRSSSDPMVEVVAARRADVPPAYRLLATVSGHVPRGYRPFDGPQWALA